MDTSKPLSEIKVWVYPTTRSMNHANPSSGSYKIRGTWYWLQASPSASPSSVYYRIGNGLWTDSRVHQLDRIPLLEPVCLNCHLSRVDQEHLEPASHLEATLCQGFCRPEPKHFSSVTGLLRLVSYVPGNSLCSGFYRCGEETPWLQLL